MWSPSGMTGPKSAKSTSTGRHHHQRGGDDHGTATREYEANTDANFTMGSRSDDAFTWTGVIDEPAYYDTALTATQILDSLQQRHQPKPVAHL